MPACPTVPKTIALRATVIDGNGHPDDYEVIWCGLSIGRIMKGTGSPNHAPQWWWECNAYGRLPLGGESGTGIDLYDCKARFAQYENDRGKRRTGRNDHERNSPKEGDGDQAAR